MFLTLMLVNVEPGITFSSLPSRIASNSVVKKEMRDLREINHLQCYILLQCEDDVDKIREGQIWFTRDVWIRTNSWQIRLLSDTWRSRGEKMTFSSEMLSVGFQPGYHILKASKGILEGFKGNRKIPEIRSGFSGIFFSIKHIQITSWLVSAHERPRQTRTHRRGHTAADTNVSP